MVSGLASPPPSLGGFGLGGLQLPKPPPGFGGKVLSGVGTGLKSAGAGAVRLGGSAVGAIALDLLFPQSVAVADLSALPKELQNQGTGTIVENEELGDPPFLGGQVAGEYYRFRVRFDVFYAGNLQFEGKLSNERLCTGPIIGIVYRMFGDKMAIEVAFTTLSGGIGYATIDSASYNFVTYDNGRFEYIIRSDGTSQEDDRTEGGDPPQPVLKPTVKAQGGILNPPSNYQPPSSDWTPYGGATSGSTNIGNPISSPPSVGGGSISPTTTSSPTNTGNNTGAVSPSGSQSGGNTSVGSASAGGSGTSGSGGIVGGGVIGDGTTTRSPGSTSGGGTETGTGLGTGSPSQTEVSEPTNTGNNTASAPPTIPFINQDGTQEGAISPTPNEPLEPAILPFPPGTGIDTTKPGPITVQDPIKAPITKTPDEPPEQEEEKRPEERIIPIPFNFDFDNCCAETGQNLDKLREDLQCVIDKICGESEPEFWEFVVVTITDPPYPKYRFDHSTQGTGEEVFIAGYFRWVVDGKPHGDEMTVRRQNQVYLKPDWAEGYSTYPCNGALLSTSELAIPKNPGGA